MSILLSKFNLNNKELINIGEHNIVCKYFDDIVYKKLNTKVNYNLGTTCGYLNILDITNGHVKYYIMLYGNWFPDNNFNNKFIPKLDEYNLENIIMFAGNFKKKLNDYCGVDNKDCKLLKYCGLIK